MSSVCWCSCGVLRETTAAYWACSASTNASCCNWGSAPMQLSSKDHSYNTTSESSLCAQHALTYQWHGLVFFFSTLLIVSRIPMERRLHISGKLDRTCQAQVVLCCGCVCVCVHVFGCPWWSLLAGFASMWSSENKAIHNSRQDWACVPPTFKSSFFLSFKVVTGCYKYYNWMYMIYVVSYLSCARLRNGLCSNFLEQGWVFCPTKQKNFFHHWKCLRGVDLDPWFCFYFNLLAWIWHYC